MSKINREIEAANVRLIHQGEIEVVTIDKALYIATEQGLDLVQMNTDDIPVCKIFDYNKAQYQKAQDEKKNKRPKQQQKEIHLSLEIQENDMKVKAKQVQKFTQEGKPVLVTLKVLGRKNNSTSETARAKLQDFMSIIGTNAPISQSGDIYSFILKP